MYKLSENYRKALQVVTKVMETRVTWDEGY